MTADELFVEVYKEATEYSMKPKNHAKAPIESEKKKYPNAIIRNNLADKKAPFFAFIEPSEPEGGVYSDISFVIFPDNSENVSVLIVCIVVGSNGFVNDFDIASQPGTKRLFQRLYRTDPDYHFFIKDSFTEIQKEHTALTHFKRENRDFFETIKKYGSYILSGAIIKLADNSNYLKDISNWLACYASLRGWKSNKVISRLNSLRAEEITNYTDIIKNLLHTDRFVVLQGAPGTGKTHTALEIANSAEYKDHTFFEQFHAETTYSDFVYGLQPTLGSSDLKFEKKEGVLYQAIMHAQDNPSSKVLLIIDEINRANLSNVLGPVFYLFEKNATNHTLKFTIGDKEIAELPSNLFVIATMNTADRSLAVVDFALRRRFTWYTIKPHVITNLPANKQFMTTCFSKICDIFTKYATDEELNLQPGQSYFIVDKDNADAHLKQRLTYELRPLIKEYLNEGYLGSAREELEAFFFSHTDLPIFE